MASSRCADADMWPNAVSSMNDRRNYAEKQCKANARSFAETTPPQRFLGLQVNCFYLASWYDSRYGKWTPPSAWETLVKTPWGSTDWRHPSSPLCKAMQDMWSKHAGKAALNNALRHNSNITKTAFDNLPVEFKLALDHDFHCKHYEEKKKTGYYDSQLGDAMLLYLVEGFCTMAAHVWRIPLAKTASGSLYLVTLMAKDKQYISRIGQLCGIWEMARKMNGLIESAVTNPHTQANLLEKMLCHMVYEIVESRTNPFNIVVIGQANFDLLYITIAFIVFHVLNEYSDTRYDKTYLQAQGYRNGNEFWV